MGGVRSIVLAPEVPCVHCGKTPTVGFAYGGGEKSTGRVCEEHGKQAVRSGIPVAADEGGGRNWGLR